MLFLIDQNPDAEMRRIRSTIESELKDPSMADFAWKLFSGVYNVRDSLDAQIRATATNWRLERMATTDRNVLRLGLFEMQHFGTPGAVVLNESIELAREFGTEHSAGFVNGILDKLMPGRTETKVSEHDGTDVESVRPV